MIWCQVNREVGVFEEGWLGLHILAAVRHARMRAFDATVAVVVIYTSVVGMVLLYRHVEPRDVHIIEPAEMDGTIEL